MLMTDNQDRLKIEDDAHDRTRSMRKFDIHRIAKPLDFGLDPLTH